MGDFSIQTKLFLTWSNPLICLGKQVFIWDTWLAKGIHVIKDLYRDGSFKSFEDLKETFNLDDKGDFWEDLQFRSSMGAGFRLNIEKKEGHKIQEFLSASRTQHEYAG